MFSVKTYVIILTACSLCCHGSRTRLSLENLSLVDHMVMPANADGLVWRRNHSALPDVFVSLDPSSPGISNVKSNDALFAASVSIVHENPQGQPCLCFIEDPNCKALPSYNGHDSCALLRWIVIISCTILMGFSILLCMFYCRANDLLFPHLQKIETVGDLSNAGENVSCVLLGYVSSWASPGNVSVMLETPFEQRPCCWYRICVVDQGNLIARIKQALSQFRRGLCTGCVGASHGAPSYEAPAAILYERQDGWTHLALEIRSKEHRTAAEVIRVGSMDCKPVVTMAATSVCTGAEAKSNPHLVEELKIWYPDLSDIPPHVRIYEYCLLPGQLVMGQGELCQHLQERNNFWQLRQLPGHKAPLLRLA
mmetsp:Transcript_96362/g.151797  ORF Transcript_96362/g.151797 Transcript_96362/m.151797 type:complete len:367 (-) Transcript_96362:28-1128(-)